tara:strand:- start:6698 stop:7546 length:849 start_codon:yes stop_codon:yes gene_type:complete
MINKPSKAEAKREAKSKRKAKSKSKAKSKRHVCKRQCCVKNFLFDRIPYVIDSFRLNYIFWIISVLSVVVLSYFEEKSNIIHMLPSRILSGISTFVITMVFGYYMHLICHTYDVQLLYEQSNLFIFKYCRTIPWLDKAIKTILIYTFDFHDKIHHDLLVNKLPANVVIECLINIIIEGGVLLFFATYVDFSIYINNYVFRFNRAVIILWGLLYSSVHNINYNIIHPIEHQNHHKECCTNFGIDTLDILLDSKYDIKNVEIFNHAAINIIVITLFILYYKIIL